MKQHSTHITIKWLTGCIVLFLGLSCKYFKPNHPQAELQANESLNEATINTYVDSVNATLNQAEKTSSLVYTLGDSSFYVTRYTYNNAPVLYEETCDKAELGYSKRRYYLKDNRVIFYSENSKATPSDKPYRIIKEYYRNDVMFYAEEKQGTEQDIASLPFTETNVATAQSQTRLARYEDALNQRGKFDLFFEGITEYPKARYLILSRKEINAYRAPVLIPDDDDLIREIAGNPNKYRGEKLYLTWKIVNGEAVYQSGKLKQ
ncbi:hypothetical protein FW774_12130 [Pedobacter sp. BS3]|uniref:hypothetical protein n=1 Tax=Pedobacter sp. BS3 TaxID=2567937 RepID=UPI0011EC316E|nr:hypothetical protein [Pedobacter sp. BS3]TZF83045.1 hypothetical protein FW774_12130 [Pedobacter sp. BS3]